MKYSSYLTLVLGITMFLVSACKLKPVDAVYLGTWVNTYTEVYDYISDSTTTLLEAQWMEFNNTLPPMIILSDHNHFAEYERSVSGEVIQKVVGKWSIRNNNDLTIQTDQYLFSGKIILLNDDLLMEGIQYPLDANMRTVREKAIECKLKYRRHQ